MAKMSKGLRSDVSNFIIHLTKNYKPENKQAQDNIISILKSKCIEARNYHCLFGDDIQKSQLTSAEKSKFKSVCFTEIPINQIQHFVDATENRKIHLQPYGIIFERDYILNKGGNPALYVNSKLDIKGELLDEFRVAIKKAEQYKQEKRKDEYLEKISKFYSLVNTIDIKKYDFSWEREWRCIGNFEFEYKDIVAVIADEPQQLRELIRQKKFEAEESVLQIPIISSKWGADELIRELLRLNRA